VAENASTIAAPNVNAFIFSLPNEMLWKRHLWADSATLVQAVQVRQLALPGIASDCPRLGAFGVTRKEKAGAAI
jgi:hypothetical protein